MSELILTPRWLPLKAHPTQIRLIDSKARFKLVPAGRRSGKTERAKRNLVLAALEEPLEGKWRDYRYFAAAPTRDQAKAIYWQDLKALVPKNFMSKPPRESDLCLQLINGAEIWVLGLDKPQRIEGRPWNGGVLDEYADMRETVWAANVRPALSDRKGWCWLIGVPEGRNHYYKLCNRYEDGSDPNWEVFTWKSADILDPEEVEAAKRDMDPLLFAQEFEASFVNFEGRAYYPFVSKVHAVHLRYDPEKPLIFCFDFNVSPGIAVVCQEQRLPAGYDGTGVIGEVHIPRNSTTKSVCLKLIADWYHHKGPIHCYGDASGGATGSAKTSGSDWEIIRDELRNHFKERVRIFVPKANPRERARVNSLNSRMMNTKGECRLQVDKRKCPKTVEDLEGVTLLKGGSGEIDKRIAPDLTHLTDALGYYIVYQYPVTGRISEIRELW